MKTQQVSVDYWAMGKAMVTYGALTALCWLMLRLFGAVFTLPRRLRAQQQTIQDSLQELQVKVEPASERRLLGFGQGDGDIRRIDGAVLAAVMLRVLFGAVFTLPQELQRRFPDLNITEEDLINAEKELEEMTKESDEKKSEKEKAETVPPQEEDKKTL